MQYKIFPATIYIYMQWQFLNVDSQIIYFCKQIFHKIIKKAKLNSFYNLGVYFFCVVSFKMILTLTVNHPGMVQLNPGRLKWGCTPQEACPSTSCQETCLILGAQHTREPPLSLLTVVNSALFVLLTTIYEASGFNKACQKLINFVYYFIFYFYFAIL